MLGQLVYLNCAYFLRKQQAAPRKLLTLAEVGVSSEGDEAVTADASSPEKCTKECSPSTAPSFAGVSWFCGMLQAYSML